MKQHLNKIFSEHLNNNVPITKVEQLHGDASNRIYSRVTLENQQTYIIMQLGKGKTSASEEITNFQGKPAELPFINIDHFLSSCGLHVPFIYHYDEVNRLMLLEDIGDKTLAEIASTDDSAKKTWYSKAVDLLITMQVSTNMQKNPDCIAFQRSFDETLLNWEFDHFLEYGLEARGIIVEDDDKQVFEAETRKISEIIASYPRCFVHRDFQSRNLMIQDEELVLIDFQDALLGPSVYDLVALIRDSYLELSDSLVNELIEQYAKQLEKDFQEVKYEFNLVTVQRKLKDSGRFVYIDQIKHNSKFLPFIPTSLFYVKDALEQLPEYEAFYEMLKKYVPEWKS